MQALRVAVHHVRLAWVLPKRPACMATFLCGLPVFEIIWKAGSGSTHLFTTGSYPAVVRCNHASTKYAEWKGAEPDSSQVAGLLLVSCAVSSRASHSTTKMALGAARHETNGPRE